MGKIMSKTYWTCWSTNAYMCTYDASLTVKWKHVAALLAEFLSTSLKLKGSPHIKMTSIDSPVVWYTSSWLPSWCRWCSVYNMLQGKSSRLKKNMILNRSWYHDFGLCGWSSLDVLASKLLHSLPFQIPRLLQVLVVPSTEPVKCGRCYGLHIGYGSKVSNPKNLTILKMINIYQLCLKVGFFARNSHVFLMTAW